MKNVIITFTPLTTPESARTCPYHVDVDLDSSIYPTTTTAKTSSVYVVCASWISSPQTTSITFEKITSGDTTTGKIRIPAILYPAKRMPDPANETSILAISCGAAVTSFFENLPAVKLADCTVRTYCPNHASGEENYKIVSGIIYYYADRLRIIPETDYWKFFYGADSDKVLYGDIGLWEDLQFTFTVPSTAPTYTELRTEADKFDLSKVPLNSL